jgi:hypothetical protein
MTKKLFFRISFCVAFAAGGLAVPYTAKSLAIYFISCIIVGVLIRKANKFIYG